MKKINSLLFILFLILVTGGFASIAQNAYGIDLLGWSTVGFTIICFFGGILALGGINVNKLSAFEYFILTILFAISSMRVFFIYFAYVEVIFILSGVLLIIVYISNIFNYYKTIHSKNNQLFLSLALFYGSVILFTLSMVLNPISNYFSEVAGVLGLLTFILAVLSKYRIASISVRNKELSITKFLSLQPNRATLLLSLYLLFTIYTAATYFDIIPDLQSSSMPKGYYELVKEAESGTDIPDDGQYRYQLYREHMEKFMKNQGLEN